MAINLSAPRFASASNRLIFGVTTSETDSENILKLAQEMVNTNQVDEVNCRFKPGDQSVLIQPGNKITRNTEATEFHIMLSAEDWGTGDEDIRTRQAATALREQLAKIPGVKLDRQA